ncbi:uncharacterized protein LOC108484092 isoform X2 [Gossypium arboreum]|uniref:uncharacterized protein LOC108484092 isoform X2 n=1 Tax=Gossypium arboreum TaxID=29729 RepID=UPI0022F168D5|nr:uncharacterized protein LOC108484092 isoform X2 [Gossypium arboreum]
MVLIELLKNFHHQVDRRRKTDKMRDLEFLTWIKSKSFPVSLQIPASFKQIKTQWLMHPDLQSILQKIQYIKAKFKDHLVKEDDANEELDTVEDELNKLDQQRSKEQKRDLDAVFSNTKCEMERDYICRVTATVTISPNCCRVSHLGRMAGEKRLCSF